MLNIPKSTFTMCIHNGPLAEAEVVFLKCLSGKWRLSKRSSGRWDYLPVRAVWISIKELVGYVAMRNWDIHVYS